MRDSDHGYSQVESVKGFVGNFTVTIRHKARYVDETKCTGCGLCTEKVPQKKAPNAFNLGLNTRRAIYIPFAQAVPKVATIDPDFCTMLKSGKCGVCAKVCTAGAIDYRAKGPAGGAAIRRHCGGHRLPPHFSGEIRGVRPYGQSPDVVTSWSWSG